MGLFDRENSKGTGNGNTVIMHNKSSFQLALREGMGFAYACKLSGNDPKAVSEYLLEDLNFYEECMKLVMGANLDKLVAASKYTEKKEWDKAEKARKSAERTAQLYTWGCKGHLEELSEDEVFEHFCELGGDYDQLAIAMAATPKELKEYLDKHIELRGMIKIMRKQWNEGYATDGSKKSE